MLGPIEPWPCDVEVSQSNPEVYWAGLVSGPIERWPYDVEVTQSNPEVY